MTKIQEFVERTPYTKNKVKFVNDLYWQMKASGADVCTLNEKYLIIDGEIIHFVRNDRKSSYTATRVLEAIKPKL